MKRTIQTNGIKNRSYCPVCRRGTINTKKGTWIVHSREDLRWYSTRVEAPTKRGAYKKKGGWVISLLNG